jgi:ankyrin repeat protein
MRACYSGNVGLVQNLIDGGATIDCTDEDGMTPLMLAAGGGHLEVAKLLLAKGAIWSDRTS